MLCEELLDVSSLAARGQDNLDGMLRVRWSVIVAEVLQRVVYSKLEAFLAQVYAHMGHIAVVHDHLDFFGFVRVLKQVRAMVLRELNGTREPTRQFPDRHADRCSLQQGSWQRIRDTGRGWRVLKLVGGFQLGRDGFRTL